MACHARPARWPASLGLLVLSTLALAGCGDEAVPVEPSPRRDLGGPWQAESFVVDQALLPPAVDACRTEGLAQPLAQNLVIADARGMSRLYLVFFDGRMLTECMLTENGAGQFTSSGLGSGDVGVGQPVAGTATIMSASVMSSVGGGGANESMTSVYGRAGDGVAAVDLILRTGGRVRASTARGWFAAWWPSDDSDVLVQEIGGNGVAIAAPHR